ncbi:MAG: hypothetical protein KDC92_02665 [Bacteroidetes bacterium]|nr:hypothetical protein [Bacteroidota bacterium]
MPNLKSHLFSLPEYLLLIAVLFYWVSTAIILNPVAIVLAGILVFQLFTKNRIVGIVIPSILILISLYMLLALFSEFNEFETINAQALKLLAMGLTLFLGTITASVSMLYKYVVDENR